MKITAENRDAVFSLPERYFFNKKTMVPPAPNPVRARAIAEKVKFPKPSTLSTLISEISRARREEEVKKRAGRYNYMLFLFMVFALTQHALRIGIANPIYRVKLSCSIWLFNKLNFVLLNFPRKGNKNHRYYIINVYFSLLIF